MTSSATHSSVQILREVLRLAWPLMLSNLFFSIQIVIDRTFLSQYDPDASAAALASSMLLWIPVIFVQNTGSFATTFVAQYFGARQFEKIGPIVWQAIYWCILGGLAMICLAPVATPLMALAGHSPKLVALEADYFFCLCFCGLPVSVTAAVCSFFSGRGDTRTVIWINAIGCVVNGLLDYCLIFGKLGFPEEGIVGAGWATVAGCTASALCGLYLFMRHQYDEQFATVRGRGWNTPLFFKLVKYGMPNGFQSTFDLIAWTLFTTMVGWFGKAELAATSNVFVINALFFIPMLGLGQASGVYVGQRLGEERPDLAERGIWIGIVVTVIFMTSMGLLTALTPGPILSLFASDKEPEIWAEVSALIPGLLWYVAAYAAFDGVNVLLAFSLRGAGDTAFISWLYLGCGLFTLGLPVYLSYVLGWGFFWAWNFAVIYLIVLMLFIFGRFLWGPWRRMRVIEPAVIETE
ncbi:MAG: MATE family efflux transporter [Gemmatales bacterium]